MPLKDDFQKFLFRGNVVDLSVGVIIGAAFGKIVAAFVEDMVMPFVSVLLPAGGWREFTFEPVDKMQLKIGHFLGATVDFIIIAAVIFFLLVKFVGGLNKKPVATKTCGECQEVIPIKATRCRACTAVVAALLLMLVPGWARAQSAPKFEFAKPAEVKAAEWKAQAKGGLLLTSGNSQTRTGTLGGTSSYKKDANRVAAEAGVAYARANVLTGVDANNDMFIDGSGNEIVRTSTTGSKAWQGKLRYDRFLTLNNSVYASAQALGDEPAGKELVAGAQVGYSRQVLKNDRHLLVAELGYDFSYERATAAGAEGVQVHSARVFAAENLKLSDATGASASFEVLTNLNKEKAPAPGYTGADGFKDVRLLGKAGLSTVLWDNVSFGFGFTFKYDNAPAPLKAFKVPFAAGFFPLSDKVDTTTEATLMVTFL